MMEIPEFEGENIRLLDDETLANTYHDVVNAVGVGAEAREFERAAAREIGRREIWNKVY